MSSSLTSRTKKKSNTNLCCSFFLRARLLRRQQLATSVANVRRSSMSAGHWRHLRLPLPKHLAPFRIKTFFNRRALLFFLCARLLRKQQLATSVANVRRSSMSARHWRHLRLPLPKHLAPSRIKTFFNRRALLFFLRARLLRKRQLATSVANVRRSSMSAGHWRHLRLPLPKHLAPSRIKRSLTEACCSFFACEVVVCFYMMLLHRAV